MSTRWPIVQLGDVVQRVERPEAPRPGTRYRQLGVRLWGEGAYEREPVDGAETKYATLSQVVAGDIVVNKIWARNGSVAVVQDDLAGCFVSGEFPTFTTARDKLLPRWMHWLTKTPGLWQQCDQKSRGTSGQNRIKPEQFLRVEIPLPPLSEQQRIVARVDALAGQVNKAKFVRFEAAEESRAFLTTARRAVISDSKGLSVPLQDVCAAIIDNLHSNPILAESGVPCVRSPDVGWGTLNLDGAQRTDEEEYRRRTVRGEPQANDIVLVREGGGTGKCAVVLPGQRFSLGQRVMMLRPDPKKILPRFLLHQLLSPLIQEEQIGPMTKGSASPHLNIAALKRFTLRLDQRLFLQFFTVLTSLEDYRKRKPIHYHVVQFALGLLAAVAAWQWLNENLGKYIPAERLGQTVYEIIHFLVAGVVGILLTLFFNLLPFLYYAPHALAMRGMGLVWASIVPGDVQALLAKYAPFQKEDARVRVICISGKYLFRESRTVGLQPVLKKCLGGHPKPAIDRHLKTGHHT